MSFRKNNILMFPSAAVASKEQRGISTTVKDYFQTIDHKPYFSLSQLSCHTSNEELVQHTVACSHTNSCLISSIGVKEASLLRSAHVSVLIII